MQISLDDLRRHYASLSDDELLHVDPDDLTEAARGCYQEEIESRGLNATGEEQPVEDEDGHPAELDTDEFEPDWLDHATCPCSFTAVPGSNYAPQVARAKDALQLAGIPCHLTVVPPDPESALSNPYDEYRVMVPDALNLKAIAVLDKELFNEDLEADWRAHLAQLSDEDLRALRPEVICAGLQDRIRRLTRAYNDEVGKRINSSAR